MTVAMCGFVDGDDVTTMVMAKVTMTVVVE